ncbi:MAG: hypothetical protein ACYCOO_00540 [Chitinophagaceae bacterium]
MDNFTHENSPSISSSSNQLKLSKEELEQRMTECNLPPEEKEFLQKTLEKIQEIKFTPREATIQAILNHSRKKDVVAH